MWASSDGEAYYCLNSCEFVAVYWWGGYRYVSANRLVSRVYNAFQVRVLLFIRLVFECAGVRIFPKVVFPVSTFD